MKKLIAFTGAGMSAESGIKTFRDSGGLWEEYNIEDVATPMGWQKDMNLVLQFYNERRRQLETCFPNEGHKGLAELEQYFDVQIITQNVDNLHERAGSSKTLHLHGELTKVRSVADKNLIYDVGYKDINPGDVCEKNSQLRPHIVWFGEPVPMISKAAEITENADILLIIGTSLNVYPAAGLVHYVRPDVPIYLIDPNDVSVSRKNVHIIKKGASEGMKEFMKKVELEKNI
jgi:NAD-dependent deacetylase